MPTATGHMTLADLRLRVAERAALIAPASDGTNAAETTQPALDQLNRAVNDGADEFYAYRSWNFADSSLLLVLNADGDGPSNIDADPGLYRLPAWVASVPRDRAHWKSDDNVGGAYIQQRHMAEVQSLAYRCPTQTGFPQMIAVEYDPSTALYGGRGRFTARVFPKPDRAYTIRMRVRAGHSPLIAEDQCPAWPPVHDMTVVALAVRSLFLADREAGSAAVRQAQDEAARRLATSVRVDDEDYSPAQIGGEMDVPYRQHVTVYGNDGSVLLQGPTW